MNTTTKKPLSARLLEKIEAEQLEPKPRWRFLLHEGVVWGVVVAAFMLGTVATALTWYIVHATYAFGPYHPMIALDTLTDVVPWLWLVLLAVGVFYSIHAFQTTARGYRFNRNWLVLGAVAASVVFGGTLSAMGFSEAVDRYLLREVALYQPMSGYRAQHWMSAADGHWAGVVRMREPEMLLLETLDGNLVEVQLTELTVVRGMPEPPAQEVYVRVVGTTTSDGMCEAYEIRPFRGRGGMRAGRVEWAM